MKFAATLKDLRDQNNVTQQELANYLKVTRSTIAGYETKGKQPDFDRLLRIADYFQVSVDFLLTGSNFKETLMIDPPFEKSRKILNAYLKLSHKSQQQMEDYVQFLAFQDSQSNEV